MDSDHSSSYHLAPIGFIRTPFKEKFGVARQSMMMSYAYGILKLENKPSYKKAAEDLQSFSHLWIIFVFHKNLETKWRPRVTTPRLNKHERVGVFASRSPHRPNPIGLSAVKVDRIDLNAAGGVEIYISGVDILDGTPVLDIKPYLPHADRIQDANSGWAQGEIIKYFVLFSPKSLEDIRLANVPHLKELLIQMLELDPRPTSQRKAFAIDDIRNEGRKFAFRVLDYDVSWEIRGGSIYVVELVLLKQKVGPP